MNLNSISEKIIQAAIAVHRELGPGLLESVYQGCMLIELQNMGVCVRGEVPLPVFYKGQKIRDEGFRIDLFVEELIVVELKSVEVVQPVHKKQLLTYLRLANKELGLLINFGEILLKKGIHRIINSPQTVSVILDRSGGAREERA
jgi:GxxExxY protein